MNAAKRRRIHMAVLLFWLVPGGILSILFAHSIAWVVAMSWFGCLYVSVSAYAAETPVEAESG